MSAVASRSKTRKPAPRSATINIRASQKARELIERAAEVSGKTLTDFLLESATERATEVLLDQRLFVLDSERFDAFLKALDTLPPPPDALRELMRKRPLWDS
jgi:uncharacterized protein (DUF1778 family)